MERYRLLLKKYWIVAAAIVLVLAGVVAFSLGYRIDRGGITQAGTLHVHAPAGSRVYLDESRLLYGKDEGVETRLRPGVHTVIVDIDGMQPWNELVELSSGTLTSLSPITVAKDVIRERLAAERIAEGRAAIRATKLPTEAAPLSINECVKVWVSGSRILATADADCPSAPAFLQCTDDVRNEDGSCPATLVFAPNAAIRSVIGYPERTDALVVAAGNLSYVIELDPRKPQFFAPLVKASVTLAPWTPGYILLDEAGVLYEVAL